MYIFEKKMVHSSEKGRPTRLDASLVHSSEKGRPTRFKVGVSRFLPIMDGCLFHRLLLSSSFGLFSHPLLLLLFESFLISCYSLNFISINYYVQNFCWVWNKTDLFLLKNICDPWRPQTTCMFVSAFRSFWPLKAVADCQTLSFSDSFYKIRLGKNHSKST
jgi:hypothetical protein